MLKDGRRSLRKSSWRNFIVEVWTWRSSRGMSEGDAETDGGRGKTEVGKLNLLCDTLRAWVSTNVASLSLSSIFFFNNTFAMLELFQLPLSKRQRVSSNSRTIAKRNLSLSSFSSLKKKKLPFPRFFHRLLPRHVASPSFVSSSLLPALSPALYVSLCLSPPLDPRVIGVDALEGDSRYGLKRMTKLSK